MPSGSGPVLQEQQGMDALSELSKGRAAMKCVCGSGEERFGICCGMVCSECEDEKKAKFRPEVFEDSDYWVDEPINEDY